MNLTDRLQDSRFTLLLDFPFFGQLALRLDVAFDYSIETAQTDGRKVLFNPDYCEKLTDPELAWLYAHEIAHPALGHLWRMEGMDPRKANIAADYVVNEMLHSIIHSQAGNSNRLRMIKGALLDSKYFGLSMEEIYHLLPDQPTEDPIGTFTKPAPDEPDQEENDSEQDGEGDQDQDGQDGKGNTPKPISTPSLEQEWKNAAVQAATVARTMACGQQLPAAIQSIIATLIEPAVPWQDLLRQFASKICRDDYSFRRPNRRYAHLGFMLPTLRSEGLGTIVVAVDTSGSISSNRELLNAFLSELQSILDTTSPEALHLLDCDATVNAHYEFHTGDDLRETPFLGGGGTRFEPVFEWLEENHVEPDCLIYFTDLYGSFPVNPPPFPVLWLNYGNPGNKAPFGETIPVPPYL